ncbi:hypothetical protein Tco_1374549 [Tanacetum coccineum]
MPQITTLCGVASLEKVAMPLVLLLLEYYCLSANVVGRSIGTDNPHLTVGSQVDHGAFNMLKILECFGMHSIYLMADVKVQRCDSLDGSREGYHEDGFYFGGVTSTLDDAKVACAEARDKITFLASERDRFSSEVSSLRAGFPKFKEKIEIQQEEQAQELFNRVAKLKAHVMDFSGRLEGKFYPAYLTTLAGKRWLLTYRIQLALLKCLKSSEYQGTLGHALGRAVDFGMQEGLEAGYEHRVAGRNLSMVEAYNPEVAKASYINAVKALEDTDFPLVNLLKSKKDAGMDKVLDCFLLDGPLAGLPEAAYLQPCIKQLSIPIHHAGDNTTVGETSLSFTLMNVHARAEGAKKRAVALRQLMIEIISALLSS